jgi:hypothetical protein
VVPYFTIGGSKVDFWCLLSVFEGVPSVVSNSLRYPVPLSAPYQVAIDIEKVYLLTDLVPLL